MWLIAGLGNPGSKYTFTRHNAGFLCIEHVLELLDEAGVSFTEKNEHKAVTWKAEQMIFAEPQTFMNLSGESIQPLMAYYKIPIDHLLVIQDDLDLPFGRIKFLKDRGPGGHNGIKNITQVLGTANYARLKIGVGGPRHPGQEGADYVLERFTEEEARGFTSIFDRCHLAIKSFIDNGYERTANVFNTRESEEEK